jgi:glycerol-3-phosphate cytidylyltransferase
MKTIGYTTGVFDLFHIGHLNILRQAKENCDYLIVGVSTDELVKSYKNKSPVIPYSERKAIIEAIRYVDEVVPQNTLDKIDAHSRLGFNVLFQGDDWLKSPVYHETVRKFTELDVKIIYFPYTKGTSSTLLSDILQKTLKET